MNRKRKRRAEEVLVYVVQQYATDRGMAFLNGKEKCERFVGDPESYLAGPHARASAYKQIRDDVQQYVETCGVGRLVWMLRGNQDDFLVRASQATDPLLVAQFHACSVSYGDVAGHVETILSGRAAELD